MTESMQQIKVATLNLYNYLEPPNAFYDFENIYSSEQWQKKQAWLTQTLLNLDADIIGFQEVFSIEALQKLVLACGFDYFETVAVPEVEGEFIHTAPVVAIASKFKVTETVAIKGDPALCQQMQWNPDFRFTRDVVRATVLIPKLGQVDCYVCHLKSKRAILPPSESTGPQTQLSDLKLIQQQLCGRWHAAMQRGSEATLLMSEIIEQRHKTERPVILMGDFNTPLQDSVLQSLDAQQLEHNHITGSNLMLFDSWQLFKQASYFRASMRRLPTHYYNNQGSVLDYILLSEEFSGQNALNLYQVSAYQTLDKHVVNPDFETEDKSSDHAIVMITLSVSC